MTILMKLTQAKKITSDTVVDSVCAMVAVRNASRRWRGFPHTFGRACSYQF